MDFKYHSRRRRTRRRRALSPLIPSFLDIRSLRQAINLLAVTVVLVNFLILPVSRAALHWLAPSWSATRKACDASQYQQRMLLAERQPNINKTIVDSSNVTWYLPVAPIELGSSEIAQYRQSDIVDTFANYKYRSHAKCSLSSLDLHAPFSPLCPDRKSFLRAFSSGGRPGYDLPYMPRDCDMRWFTTAETCEILSRFEKVIVVGDSLMRHVIGALNVILRENLGYGAVTGWNFGEEELEKCFCTHQMDVKACSLQGIFRTEDVLKHDPDSFKCSKETYKDKTTGEVVTTSNVNLIIELMLKHPLDQVEVERFQSLLPTTRPKKPLAFIFGHGLWNDLDLQATVHWVQGILEAMYARAEYLRPENMPQDKQKAINDDGKEVVQSMPMAHILFVPPSAAGTLKPDQWILSQGNKALQIFEESLYQLIHSPEGMFYGKGMEHMGTWNMSIQMHKWDGVHLDLKGNLIKAMGVINWLAGIDVEKW